jgi:hypothetical protein
MEKKELPVEVQKEIEDKAKASIRLKGWGESLQFESYIKGATAYATKWFECFEENGKMAATIADHTTKLRQAEEKIKELIQRNSELATEIESVGILVLENEKLKAQATGPRWVKASEYDHSRGGVLFYRFLGPTLKSCGTGNFSGGVFHGLIGDHFSKDKWEYLYILDESAGESDAVIFAEWVANNYSWEYDPVSDEYQWLEANNFYTTDELYTIFKQKEK